MRRNFNSSQLVRLLADWTQLDAQASGPDFAERLSAWLGPFDAIRLRSVHQAIEGLPPASGRKGASVRPEALAQAIQQVRSDLAQALAARVVNRYGSPQAGPGLWAGEEGTRYAPHLQFYLDQQRQMEQKLTPLRAQCRQALIPASPRLRQLAALDAALEPTLAGREQKLLARVPVLLERRYGYWCRPAGGEPPSANWLTAFGQEVQALLLAELEVRCWPVLGLMEAFSNEVEKSP